MTLQEIVDDYRARFRADAKAELDSFRDEKTLEAAVQRACLTIDSEGRRESHHFRRQSVHLQAGAARLIAHLDEIRAVTNFAKLHALCERLLGLSLQGLGPLYVYDTALNISAKLGHMPKAVYLHAGTRGGAAALGLQGDRTLLMSELPSELRALEPYEVEDVLCIYKDHIRDSSKAPPDKACWLPEETADADGVERPQGVHSRNA
jgi:hypothetical protein